ncbi:MAG: CARDB domain-containing protein [Thermoplasmatota archaeon]
MFPAYTLVQSGGGPVGTTSGSDAGNSATVTWARYGELEWSLDVFPGTGAPLSTPELADLDGDGTREIIVMNSNGSLQALDHNGASIWTAPVEGLNITMLGEDGWLYTGEEFGPPFFPSPVAWDLDGDGAVEILAATMEGVKCFDARGALIWEHPVEDGGIFCTPTITDIQGDFSISSHLEILFVTDFRDKTSNLTILNGTDGSVVLDQRVSDWYPGTSSSVVTEDMDGSFYDNGRRVIPGESDKRYLEAIYADYLAPVKGYSFSMDGYGNLTASEDGEWAGTNFSPLTPAVANLSGQPGMEIVSAQHVYGGTTTFDYRTAAGELIVGTWGSSNTPWRFKLGMRNCGIYSSPAIADLHQAWMDPENEHLDYEIMFGSYNGMLYVLNSEMRSVAWQFDTGGPILASPAVADLHGDEDLEVVISSLSGKIFCFDGDPADGNDEGIPYPGDGPAQDVLWIYETGEPLGISSPVIADIDLDGVLEVIFGGEDGTLFCISSGGLAGSNNAPWPTFHGNHNRTGYYTPPTNYVDVDMHPKVVNEVPEKTIKKVLPGYKNLFNVTVENTGLGLDPGEKEKIFVKFDAGSVKPGWNAWLDTPSDQGNDSPDYVRLGPGEQAEINLHVWSPWTEDFGASVTIRIDAWAESDPRIKDTIYLTAVVEHYLHVYAFFLKQVDTDPLSPLKDMKWDKINPGEFGLHTISVQNKGNVNDTYDLSLSTPPADTGWNWYFLETGTLNATVHLTAAWLEGAFGGISGTTYTLRVECPAEATKDTRVPIVMKARSSYIDHPVVGNQEGMEGGDELVIVVNGAPGLRLWADSEEYWVDPFSDERLDIPVFVENTGNYDVMNVLFSIEGKVSGWEVRYPEQPVPVLKDQVKIVTFTVYSPQWARATDGDLRLNILAVIEGGPNFRGPNITVRFLERSGLLIGLDLPVNLGIDPGDFLEAQIRMLNTGNVNDTIHVTDIKADDDLEVSLRMEDGSQASSFGLPAGGEVERLDIRVKAEADALMRERFVTIELYSVKVGPRTVRFSVNVTGQHGASITGLGGESLISDSVSEGQEKRYMLEVSNLGNLQEMIEVRACMEYLDLYGIFKELEDGWEAGISGISPTGEPTGALEERPMSPYYLPSLPGDALTVFMDRNGTPVLMERILINMGPFSKVYVELTIGTASSGGTLLLEKTTVDVVAIPGAMTDDFDRHRFIMDVDYPDIAFGRFHGFLIDGDPMTSDPLEGEEFTVAAEVINNGTIPSGQARVSLYVDGLDMGSVTLPPLSPGGSFDINFDISLDAGSHRMRLVIDPDNDVHEYRDQFMENGYIDNNQKVLDIEVREEESSKTLLVVAIILTGLICLLLVILSVRALLHFRDRSTIASKKDDELEWKGAPPSPSSPESSSDRYFSPYDPPRPPYT